MAGLILPYRGVMPTIADGVFVAPTAAVIGDVEIGPECSIWFGVTIRGDMNLIRIGRRSNVQDGTVFHIESKTYGTFIGDDVTIGHGAIVHACTLEDGSFIGMGATVMDGAVVDSKAMVAASALVTPGMRVKSGELWAGVPAKFMRPLDNDDLDNMTHVTLLYVNLAKEYLQAGI